MICKLRVIPSVARNLLLAFICCVLAFLAIPAAAQNITGSVTNGTTGKPSAGDDVALIKISQGGMEDAGSTKTDAQGHFAFSNVAQDGPHLVRVEHEGVNYHKMVPPGRTTADMQVFEAVKTKLDGIEAATELGFQAQSGTLQMFQVYAINNASKPPRTLASERTFEVAIPDGAQIDDVSTQAPNGQPLSASLAPVPGKKGVYSLDYPLRPGTTQIRFEYHMPYSGSARIDPGIRIPVKHLVVAYPSAMQLAPADARTFNATPSGDTRLTTQMAVNVAPGAQMAFTISGTGAFPDDAGSQGGDQSASAGAMGGGANDARPGGGLGAPIDAPDPLTKYRWPILGALGVVLMAGAAFVASRQNQPLPAPAAAVSSATVAALSTNSISASPQEESGPKAVPINTPAKSAKAGANGDVIASANGNGNGTNRTVARGNRETVLLEAMKEELFQLEMDFTQGRITEAEYQQTKAGLQAALRRAVSRAAVNQ
jgi:hypothetical protein